MRTNVALKYVPVRTYEGGVAANHTAFKELERAVATCMLGENAFYEKGSEIVERIEGLCRLVTPEQLAKLAVSARENFKLRHVPLLLSLELIELVRGTSQASLASSTISNVIRRPDELAEIVSLYWRNGKKSLPKQLKLGLSEAFPKFNEYQLAKWNRDSAIKLRDVLFLCHAKPKGSFQEEVWKALVDNILPIPDTWETELSAGKDKKATWERLISENKLGAIATLMNIRNMELAGVSRQHVMTSLSRIGKNSPALPFRFISAAKHAPGYANELSDAMLRAIVGKLDGYTQVVIDVSGSMQQAISGKSRLARWEAAGAMAVLFRQLCDNTKIYTFATSLKTVSNYRGLALIDQIRQGVGGSTQLRYSLQQLKTSDSAADRLIVITDEQSQDGILTPWAKHSYLVNVAGYRPGLDTSGGWTRFSGFSERIADFICWQETGKILSAEDDE